MSSVDIDNDLKMVLKKNHASSRKYRYSLRPDSGLEYSPTDTIRFQIPSRRKNTFLVNENCFLKFKVSVSGTTQAETVYFDGSASSVIQRVEEFSSGNLLSSLDNYNSLFDVLLHSKMSQSAEKAYGIFLGTSDVVGEEGRGKEIVSNQNTSGEYVACVPIMSPFVGHLNEQNLPVWALDDIRLEITLATLSNALVVSGGTATMSISDVSMELEFIELSDEAMRMAMSYALDDGSLAFHSNAFRAYTASIPADSSGVQSQLVNAKFSSLKTLYSVYLNSTGALSKYSTTSRVKAIKSYQVKVGSMLVPQAPLRDTADMFLASQMAVHNSISSMASKGGTTLDRYTNNISAAPATYTNDYFQGISLDNIHGSNHLMMSGVNSTGENVFVEIEMSDSTTENLFCVHYAEHDVIFTIEGGVARVKF